MNDPRLPSGPGGCVTAQMAAVSRDKTFAVWASYCWDEMVCFKHPNVAAACLEKGSRRTSYTKLRVTVLTLPSSSSSSSFLLVPDLALVPGRFCFGFWLSSLLSLSSLLLLVMVAWW